MCSARRMAGPTAWRRPCGAAVPRSTVATTRSGRGSIGFAAAVAAAAAGSAAGTAAASGSSLRAQQLEPTAQSSASADRAMGSAAAIAGVAAHAKKMSKSRSSVTAVGGESSCAASAACTATALARRTSSNGGCDELAHAPQVCVGKAFGHGQPRAARGRRA